MDFIEKYRTAAYLEELLKSSSDKKSCEDGVCDLLLRDIMHQCSRLKGQQAFCWQECTASFAFQSDLFSHCLGLL